MKISKFVILTAALVTMMLFASSCPKYTGLYEPEEPQGEAFVLKAVVNSVTDRLEVEVIESDYAFGVYWVLLNENTKYENSEGQSISLSDIKPGDTIEITYNGQTMLSYPPQIVAWKVTLI